jgi:nitric oxide reductase NorE protein
VPPAREEKPTRRIPGEAGMWVFIFGDMTMFALLFGVYVDARSKDPALFRHSQTILNPDFGAINTLLLLCSSILVVTAVRAMRAGAMRLAPPLVLGAMACGLGFCVTKYLEWGDHLRDGYKPATNAFWMYYYILTGLHFVHLLLGIGVLTFIYRQSRKPSPSARTLALVEGGACFWHMVDLLWIVLFPLLYLVR